MFITNFDLAQGYFDVGSKADFWDYVQETLIPQTFRTVDYNGGDVAEDDTRFLDNGYFLRLGPPSLRQFRVPKGTSWVLRNCFRFRLKILHFLPVLKMGATAGVIPRFIYMYLYMHMYVWTFVFLLF